MKPENTFILEGNIVDVVKRRIFKGRVEARNGRIVKITETPVAANAFILPGLIDAHVHVESSMLIPSEFARLAVPHGTVASVSDPHEIGNVLGVEGVRYMINNSRKVPFKFYFGAPSCVPATPFETSGAQITAEDVKHLLETNEVKYLAEMMNFPGVLSDDPQVKEMLQAALENNKPIDGHAPGVLGDDAKKYAAAGITTDHECFSKAEALDKIAAGMKIQIREGSAAKNFDELVSLLDDHPDKVMFCSDDKHPDNLVEGHINKLVSRAIDAGYDKLDVLRAATLNPARHYSLEAGLLQENDPADIIVVDSLEDFNVLETYINGQLVALDGQTHIRPVDEVTPNIFKAAPVSINDIAVEARGKELRVFKALDGQLITESMLAEPLVENGRVVSDTQNDILKIVVLNRYEPAKPAVAFVHNFGFKQGAIASSVAHDSHNVIAVGVSDEEIVKAMNLVIEETGGISWVNKEQEKVLPLPVAGIMSNDNGYNVASKYAELDAKAKNLGSSLNAPYMTLSFMALLVIPHLKLSDKGLFDGDKFAFTDLFAQK
ncbi:MAG: adenine deaminase [Bacteroidota bacterium]